MSNTSLFSVIIVAILVLLYIPYTRFLKQFHLTLKERFYTHLVFHLTWTTIILICVPVVYDERRLGFLITTGIGLTVFFSALTSLHESYVGRQIVELEREIESYGPYQVPTRDKLERKLSRLQAQVPGRIKDFDLTDG